MLFALILCFLGPQQALAQSVGCTLLNSSPYTSGFTITAPQGTDFVQGDVYEPFALEERVTWSAVSSGNGDVTFNIGTGDAFFGEGESTGGANFNEGDVHIIAGTALEDRQVYITSLVDNRASPTVPSSVVVTASCTPAAPTITNSNPSIVSTLGTTNIIIDGSNFLEVSGVTIGGNPANFTVNNRNQILATAPIHGAGPADIVVTTPGGVATGAGLVTYVAPPTITSNSPTAGPTTGGTQVQITGTNFTNASFVSVAGVTVTSFTIDSATQITATTAAGSAGIGDIIVITPGGTVIRPNSFTYVTPPTLASSSPPNGPTTGGTSVVITGANLLSTTSVSIAGTPATGFTINGPTQITATTGAGSAGTGDIIVTTLGGTVTLPSSFTYVTPPTITGSSPSAGPTTGGTSVVITGANLSNASFVSIAGTPVSGFTVNSPTQITATTAVGSAGLGDIIVTTPGGTITHPNSFTYVAPPTLTSVSPPDGPLGGGTTVVITGTNLSTANAVSIGGTAAAGFTVNSPTEITATTPAGSVGAADVVVTTIGGSETLTGGFIYVAAPTLTSVSPPNGPASGGTSVVLIGTNFSNATSVSFGGAVATGFTVNSATQITATTPAGSAGAADVMVVTAGGPATLPGGFTYVPAPTLTSVSPADGPLGGGTTVVITGTDLSTATSVSIGGTAVTGFTVISPTQITVTTPAGSAGPADVVVTTVGGSETLTGGFTYVPAPTLTSVSPPDGPTAGGTAVVITGTNLSTATSVSIGGTAVTGFTVISPTQITVTTPAGSVGAADIAVTTVGGSVTLTGGFTYVSAPTLTSVSPPDGPLGGGTSVVIMGANLANATSVSFGGTAATFTVNSPTQITATTPAGSAGAADVVVTTAGGNVTLAGGFTYVPAPTLSSVSPPDGPTSGGASVVLTGANLSNATFVSIGGTAATAFTVNSPTQITATTPAGSVGPADVVVTTAGGSVTLAGGFTYVPAPTVTSVSPQDGPTTGGTVVVITGTNLSNAASVSFGSTAAASFTVDGPTQITATTPAGSAGPADVIVATAGGSTALTGGFTYVPAPALTSVSPPNGPLGGGTTVVITGTNLSSATSVSFGGTAATAFTINSATQITATTPAGSAGPADVVVTTVGGSMTLTGGFTYVPAPTLTSALPADGPTSGGTVVVISGTDLSSATSVSFGGTAAVAFTASATQITATTPAGSAGPADIVVTTAGGSETLTGGFTYVPAPTLTSVSPPDGPTSGGTSVVITGTNFSNASAVSFGATAATSFTVDSATQITATTPSGGAGAVDVVVTTVGGSVTLTGGFTYVAAPALTSVAPADGPTAGGTAVVITGTSLSNASAVSFGATAATSFTINSATQITAITPAGSAGPVDVVVVSAGGVATLTGGFTYVAAPTLTSVSPPNGSTGGGTTVVISGTDLASATSVSFGGTAATAFTANATQITATTPAGSAGPVDVVVTTAGGSVTLTGGFTYVIPVPSITSVSPNTGSIAGGTAVTVNGTGLTGASSLTFGGTAATSFTVVSDIQITAVTPVHVVGPVDVSLTTPGGADTLAAGFTYTAAPPTLSSASPNDGSTTGGTTVTIVGANLNGANSVVFGVTPAASYTVVSDTLITAVSPAHAAGTVDIIVTTPLGSASLPGAFTFTSPLPTVVGISPNTGATLGGTSVVITGSNFAGASAVSFGGIAASSFVIDSASQITAVSPAHAAGAVNVVVTTPAGSSAAGAVFTYIVPVRPDPSLDPEVVGLINAQASTATRFARTQMRNFHGRLERLHNERERRAASMDVRFGFPTEKRKENAVERLLDQQTSNAQRLSKTEKPSAASSYGYGTDGVGPISGAVAQGQTAGGGEAEPENSRLAFWSGGFVNFGDREDSGVDIDHTNVGVSGGFDYRFSDRFVAGLGIGFSRDRTDVGNNGTESEAHAFSAAVYGSFEPVDNFFIDGLFGGGTLNFDSRRYVTSTGDFAIGERDGSQVFGSLTAAYELREESWLVSPYARVEFSRSWLDEFTETGGGIYNLTYGKQTVDSFSGILGVRANKAFEMDWGILRPGIRAEYVHDFDGSSRARLGYADLGGLPYEVELQDKERDYLTLGLSMELQFENNWDLTFDYRAMLDGEGDAEQTVGVQLSVRF